MPTFDHYALWIPDEFTQLSFIHTSTLTPDSIVTTLGVSAVGDEIDQAQLDAIKTAWATHLVDNMDDSITFVRVDSAEQAGVTLTSASGAQGTTVGTGASLNCAAIIKKVTGQPGRKGRGRMYLPTVAEANVDAGGNLTSGFIDAMNDSMADFVADSLAAGAVFYLLHSMGWNGTLADKPAFPGTGPGQAGLPDLITSFVCQPKIGTQRRRIR